MKWAVSGQLDTAREEPVSLVWEDDGALTGTPSALVDISEIEDFGRIKANPSVPAIEADRRVELSAYYMALAVVWNPEVEGEPPPWPTPPEGQELPPGVQ